MPRYSSRCFAALSSFVPALLAGAPAVADAPGRAGPPPLGVYMDTLPDGNRRFPPEAAVRHFEEQTGVDVTLFETFFGWHDWRAIEAPEESTTRLAEFLAANPDKGVIVSLPPFPGTGGSNPDKLARCAAGEFNPHYETFARRMRDVWGIDRLIIRFGWEWDGGWYPWGTANDEGRARDFAACFRNFVETVDRAFPGNRFVYDWNPTDDATNSLLEAAWPGDAYVDVVGVDAYDEFWGDECDRYDGPCRWRKQVGPHLIKMRDFARARGKPLSIPEWGVWNVGQAGDDGRGGGDNAHYIEQMCRFIIDPANNVAYSSYFEDDAAGDTRLSHPKNSRALAAFREHCAGAPTADLGHGLDDGIGGAASSDVPPAGSRS